MEPGKARTLATVASVILKAHEQGELQTRLETLEAQLAGQHDSES